MKKITLNLFPGGRNKALVMSYDDGPTQDRRLVEIFNKYGIIGTFHLNSGLMNGDSWRIDISEVAELFKGHEVSAHSVSHPKLESLATESFIDEIREDRRTLEGLVGYPVRGMSYPYGTYGKEVLELLPRLGIEYARTVNATGRFSLPDDFILWHPTCHHNANCLDLAKRFLDENSWGAAKLFYLWGHSYEFDNDNNWNVIEDFCKLMGGREDVWYPTNIQLVDYLNAARALKFSVSRETVYNPSAQSVWFTSDDDIVEVGAGMTIKLP